jgi:predicted RNase H-like HicB family nuclease
MNIMENLGTSGTYEGFNYSTYRSEKTGIWHSDAFDEVGACVRAEAKSEEFAIINIKDAIDGYIEEMG